MSAKSDALPTSAASAVIVTFVMVSGLSPVFWMSTGSWLSTAAVPAGTDGNFTGRPSSVGTDALLRPFRLVKRRVGIGDRAAVVLLVVVPDLVGGRREDRAEVDLAGAGRARRAATAVRRRRVAAQRHADAVLDVEHLDARFGYLLMISADLVPVESSNASEDQNTSSSAAT